ncbi:MAG: glycerate kinase [Bifidobacteriaceae bacterium]|jgi:glycerate kinase|nr:glycerate kinase [Bifidobacteriaceae bacterium]
MTRYLCAPDSFKESLSAKEVAAAMREGILRADAAAEVACIPLADGGEGTMQALVEATDGEWREAVAHDALRRPITARFGVLGHGRESSIGSSEVVAVVETAEASGLARLDPAERSLRATTSYGTGELIEAALDFGATTIIVALGGSASNDAGAGLITALGVRLLDTEGHQIGMSGGSLAHVDALDITGMDPRLAHTTIVAASDVTNPLLGVHGATRVFGLQKGGSPEDLVAMEGAIAHYMEIVVRETGNDVAGVAGAGAAGGIGAALLAFLGASLRPGFDVVAESVGLETAMAHADIVMTGEGRIDAQTQFGKVPSGVAAVAQAQARARPVIVLAGSVERGIDPLYDNGITAVFGITPGAASLDDLLESATAAANVSRTAEQVARLVQQMHAQ